MTSTIGRYVSRFLLGRFALILVGIAALMLLLEFLADSDQVIAASDHAGTALLLYMTLRLPDIVGQLIPIAALLAGLLSFAELARHSELTAIFAAGLSKFRLAVAIVPVVIVVALLQLVIEDQARPLAIRELRAWGVGDYKPPDGEEPAIWLRRGSDILEIRKIDPDKAELRGVTIFERDGDGNLVAKIEAARAAAEDDRWMLHDVSRSAVGSATAETFDRLPWAGDLAPGDLGVLITNPPEMSLLDLVRVVRHPELGGQPRFRYETWLQERLAGPVTTAMLLLLTVGLARPPRGRASQGMLIAMGLGIGFVLWTFDGLVLNFGDLGLIPPVLAAWTPVAVIAAVAVTAVLHDHDSRAQSRRLRDPPGPRTAPVPGTR
jgi:lipopolysaccharide export system permease protein